jgi:hypothetical protein
MESVSVNELNKEVMELKRKVEAMQRVFFADEKLLAEDWNSEEDREAWKDL